MDAVERATSDDFDWLSATDGLAVGALCQLNRILQLFEKTGPIACCERSVEASAFPGLAQMSLQVAHRHRRTYVCIGVGFARWSDALRSCLQTSCSEQDVCGDDNVEGPDSLGNPIVCGVCSLRDNNALYQRVFLKSHPAVGHHEKCQPMPVCNADSLSLYRTRIGINVDLNFWCHLSGGSDLVRPNAKRLEGVRAECGGNGDIRRIATPRDQDAPDAGGVVSRIERVPLAAEIRFKPGCKVSRWIRRSGANVPQIARAIAGRNVEGAAERNCQMGVIPADAFAPS
jgi:hypothetical protein